MTHTTKCINYRKVSLCDISKISISSNNGIPNYRYRDIDSCLTDSSLLCPFVRPFIAQIISFKSRQKRLNPRLRYFRDFLRDTKLKYTQKNRKTHKQCLSAHNYKTTGPIAKIQTVLESAHQGEGLIFLKPFFLEKKNCGFFFRFFL
jgi:hypothetical protein